MDTKRIHDPHKCLASDWRPKLQGRILSKNLIFILSAQYPNGGWPQVVPLEGCYHNNITFNDDAMTHILELLQAIEKKVPQFAFLDPKLQEMVTQFLNRVLECVFAAQVCSTKSRWYGAPSTI